MHYNAIVKGFPQENLPLSVSTRRKIILTACYLQLCLPPIDVGKILLSVIDNRMDQPVPHLHELQSDNAGL